MRLTETAAHAALDAVLPAGANQGQLSLHSAFSTTGANLVGAKTNATFGSASGRSKALSAAVDITVPGPGPTTVRWVGAWSADGTTFKGMVPNMGVAKTFQVDLSNNRILCEGHGFIADDKVAFFNDVVPTGLTEGTEFFVVGVTAADPDYFQVSLTQGGSAIDITGQPSPGCYVSKLVPETYSGAGVHRVTSYTVVA